MGGNEAPRPCLSRFGGTGHVPVRRRNSDPGVLPGHFRKRGVSKEPGFDPQGPMEGAPQSAERESGLVQLLLIESDFSINLPVEGVDDQLYLPLQPGKLMIQA